MTQNARGVARFDTAIGVCAIAWNERGIAGIQLPESSVARMTARLAKRFPNTPEVDPPAHVQQTIERIRRLLAGESVDFTDVQLDLEEIDEFDRRVYEITRRIGPGATVSYGEIARELGGPQVARAVGQALGRNPFPIIVPCHRVLAADGALGGFSAAGGLLTKQKMLQIESRQRALPF